MITTLTPKDLIAFESDIAEEFNNGNIRAPIHLYSNNEEEMLKIFQDIKHEDYVTCSWRSHYQCLLKGVPKEELKKDILKGKSISLCYSEYRIFSSGIVTGNLSISVGLALAIKLRAGSEKVYCFIGDMTSETGAFYECLRYSVNHDLPVKFIIEDNNKSVCTDTRKTWGTKELQAEKMFNHQVLVRYIYYYKYDNRWPHAGSGKRIQF